MTLSGTVDSYAERYQAELLASEVHGVKEVKNSIFTKWESSRSDQEIKNDVLAALERDVYLSGLPITASVEDGTVTLSGSVGNAYEKQRAADDARWISNVTNVKNDLGVKWYEEHGVRGKKPIRTEEQLAASVYDALRQDTRVPSSDIHVNVQYGHVTLDGSVYTRYEEQIAEEDAQNVVGVAWVSNHLFARADKRADWAIAGDVDFNLATDAVLDGFDIDTNVKDGIVTLSGQVHSWYERSHADSVASRVKGVKRRDQQYRSRPHELEKGRRIGEVDQRPLERRLDNLVGDRQDQRHRQVWCGHAGRRCEQVGPADQSQRSGATRCRYLRS